MTAPRKLSSVDTSPFFDAKACARIDKVFVDGVHVPHCVAYDMDAGWAKGKQNGVWGPRIYGVVTVKERPA